MALFTSSSDRREGLFYLFFAFLVAVIALINLAISQIAPQQRELRQDEKLFWHRKVAPQQDHNLVIYGDSRCYRGIDSGIIGDMLELKAVNLGLSSGGMNHEMCRFVDSALAEDGHRVVVLAITPYSLTPDACRNQHYRSLKNSAPPPGVAEQYAEILFTPRPWRYYREMRAAASFVPREKYHVSSGWCETFIQPEAAQQQQGLNAYRAAFAGNTFYPPALQETLRWIRLWRSRQVTVFAFRPPSLPGMEALEDSLSRCDYGYIRREVEKAGGIWLTIPDREKYNAYDASHLDRTQAKTFSRFLAAAIRRKLSLAQ